MSQENLNDLMKRVHPVTVSAEPVGDCYRIVVENLTDDKSPPYVHNANYTDLSEPGTWVLLCSEADHLPGIFYNLLKVVFERQEVVSERKELLEQLRVSALLSEGFDPVIEMRYSGSGDDSDINEISDVPEGFETRVCDFLWGMMWSYHSGFENNDGGQGTVTWDLKEDTITIDHEDNYISVTPSSTVL